MVTYSRVLLHCWKNWQKNERSFAKKITASIRMNLHKQTVVYHSDRNEAIAFMQQTGLEVKLGPSRNWGEAYLIFERS